jgi:hypothetical protein
MCKHWGIPWSTYKRRLSEGWSEKDTLETPVKDMNCKCVDHEGNEFSSLSSMCKYWGVKKANYSNRLKLGWNQQDALMMADPSMILDADLISMTFLEPGFYKVIYLKKLDIWTHDELMTYYRTTNNLKITS